MTAQETAILIGALVGLFTAFQAWLAAQTVTLKDASKEHSAQLNGLMAPRIQVGAETAIALDHQARSEPPTLDSTVTQTTLRNTTSKPFSSPRG